MRLTLLALVLVGGCASAPLKPEPRVPDPEQLAALLAAPVSIRNSRIANAAATFAISAPHVILEGNAFYVTCYVPQSMGPGHIRVALEGVDVSTKAIAGVETSLRVRPSCGTWVATCLVQTATGTVRRLEQDVEVRGGMCEADR